MRMTIKIVSFSGKPLDGAEVQFDERGGTIGRRVDCTLVIPDKERHVSRVHAVVTSGASGFVIHDQGSFLPVRVNGMEIGFGQEALLCEGDDLLIGPFGLRVLDMENDWDAAMRPGSQLGLAVAARSAAGNPGASRLPETDVALSLMETDLRRPPAAPEVDDAPPSAPDYPISASPDPGALAGSTKPKSPARKRTRRRQAADPEAEHRAKQVPDGGIGNVATAPGPALENAATRVLPGSGGGASASEDPALSPNDPGPMMERSTWDPDTIEPWHSRLPSTNDGSPPRPRDTLAGGSARREVNTGQRSLYRLKIGTGAIRSMLAWKNESIVPTSRQ